MYIYSYAQCSNIHTNLLSNVFTHLYMFKCINLDLLSWFDHLCSLLDAYIAFSGWNRFVLTLN